MHQKKANAETLCKYIYIYIYTEYIYIYIYIFSVVFYIESSHLFCIAKQMSGFEMNEMTKLKWVNQKSHV